jgi:hypothetical protein
MNGASAGKDLAVPPLDNAGPAWSTRPMLGNQDVRTVQILRLGVGVIGTLLPITLIVGNAIAGDTVIVPSSMSGSYYTSTRNVFVGSLCALGVFLIGYRHTRRQDIFTWIAGICAVLVALAPTAPAPPPTEPAWVNYLHHSAAGVLIFTLGVFCWVVFAEYTQPPPARPASLAGRLRAWASSVRAWLRSAWASLRHLTRDSLFVICGLLVFVSGAFALYTGIWPTSWSTGWPSLYLFEAVAVFSFGTAWIVAGLESAVTINEQLAGRVERQLGPDHPDTRKALANLAASYQAAGRTGEAIAVQERIADRLKHKLGPDHPDTLTAQADLAAAYQAAGRTDDAVAMGEQVAAGLTRSRAADPPLPGS